MVVTTYSLVLVRFLCFRDVIMGRPSEERTEGRTDRNRDCEQVSKTMHCHCIVTYI